MDKTIELVNAIKDIQAMPSVIVKVYRNSQPTNNNFGDADNLAKFILDACNGILWIDDRFITELIIQKFHTDLEPHVNIFVCTDSLEDFL